MEYDYHNALAAQQLNNTHQLHPAMAQIPMLSAHNLAGLNLTVMPSGQLGQQHQLGHIQGHHQIMYQNVQPAAQNATHVQQHHQQQPQQQQNNNNHGHHQQQVHQNQGHGGRGSNAGNAVQISGKGKKKQIKVNKDGVPAPKRATTAYINFTQWYREELKKSGRAIPKIGDFGKECAAKWNGMQEEDKKPFLDVAAKDRDRYKKEMEVFKPARDANKPKRPGTAFMLFMGDFRKEMAGKEPEGGVAALAKLGGERWRNMSEDDKRPYVEKQNVEKQRYEVAMEEYRRKSAGGSEAMTGSNNTEGSSEVGSPGETSNSNNQDAKTADNNATAAAVTTEYIETFTASNGNNFQTDFQAQQATQPNFQYTWQ